MCTVTNSVSMSKIAISTMVTETVIFLQFTDDIFNNKNCCFPPTVLLGIP